MDLDVLRQKVYDLSASGSARALRLHLFDLYRYMEDFDKLYDYVTMLGVCV